MVRKTPICHCDMKIHGPYPLNCVPRWAHLSTDHQPHTMNHTLDGKILRFGSSAWAPQTFSLVMKR